MSKPEKQLKTGKPFKITNDPKWASSRKRTKRQEMTKVQKFYTGSQSRTNKQLKLDEY